MTVPNIWLVSDTHFCHSNFLNFVDKGGNKIRPFKNVWEMDQCMLDNWNSVVGPDDVIWHLGDVFIGNRKSAGAILHKLNGTKHLIIGNHDHLVGKEFETLKDCFQTINFWQVWKKYKFILSHIPINPQQLEEKEGYINIHGHIHANPSPSDRHINISVERINYTPIHVEEVVKLGT